MPRYSTRGPGGRFVRVPPSKFGGTVSRGTRVLAGSMLLATAGIQLGRAVMSTRSGRKAVRMAGRGLARGARSIGRGARRFYGNQYVKLGIGRSRGRSRMRRGRR